MTSPPAWPGAPWPARDADHLLVSSRQMAALEEQLFASGLPVEALMEKAALAVSRCLLAQKDRLEQGVMVLVGPGHNGGDGLVVARELHLAGVNVRLWCPFDRLKPLVEQHRRHGRWLGLCDVDAPPDPADGALWIDALFGIGQRRPPGSNIEGLLEERQRQRPGRLVAIDVPTGLCADSGRLLGAGAATAVATYTIGLIKQGLVQDRALARVGRLERIDLGLSPALLASLPTEQPLGLLPLDLPFAPRPSLDPAAGKYERGRLLVVAGSDTYPGAAHLALLGATAGGCGSLRAQLPAAVAHHLWQVLPEVVVQQEPPTTAQLERLDALLVGPGLGPDGAPYPCVGWSELKGFAGLLVLDADGLNHLARNGGERWLSRRVGPTWLTPHRGEFTRLFPDLAEQPALAAAAAASGRTGATVLLKGARSVVATADGRTWQVLQAWPEAARAGLGDVLAGYAAALGARARAAGAVDGALLAAAALAHGLAGRGGGSPVHVAQRLPTIWASFDQH
ncbi:MAG: NAD(P)H-hydrate dehydratase [Cyanobacteriota bacterium]|nr:NAD(P)H-hydrate dehydratase [Cyanobacteriota bacterium]